MHDGTAKPGTGSYRRLIRNLRIAKEDQTMTEAKPQPLSAEELAEYFQQHAVDDGTLADWPNSDVGRLLDHITSLQAENAALVEALQDNWMQKFPDEENPSTYGCRFCDASSVSINSTMIRHDDDCPAFNPTSAGAALLKRLEDAEAEVERLSKLNCPDLKTNSVRVDLDTYQHLTEEVERLKVLLQTVILDDGVP